MIDVCESSEDEIRATPRNNTSRRRIISPPMEESKEQVSATPGGSSQKDKGLGKPRRSSKYSRINLVAEASQMVARIASEWIDEVDEMRIKSGHLQGGISGDIKWRLNKIKKSVGILAQRVEDTGDVEFLRRKNAELEAQIRAAQMEERLMKEDMATMEGRIRDLRREMRALKDRMGSRSVSLELEQLEENAEGRKGIRERKLEPRGKGKLKSQTVSLKEIDNGIEEMLAYDEQLSQQMELIKKIRDVGRKQIGEATGSDSDLPRGKTKEGRRSSDPRVTSKAQVVPSRGSGTELDIEGGSGWTTVTRGRRKHGGPREAEPTATAQEGATRTKRPGYEGMTARANRNGRRRPPTTAAVSLRTREGEGEGTSYADILKTARGGISLAELGIANPRIRKAVNGGIIIEVPGADGAIKADSLANKLQEVVGQMAHVARPYAKGEMLLVGLDESISQEEIVAAIVEVGKCRGENVRIGPIRPMRSGLGLIWAQCPLEVVNQLLEVGRLLVGWSSVRVAPVRPRPVQCFRCWRLGHVRGTCRAPVDRGRSCFRCEKEGHLASICGEPFSCVVCAEEGRESSHKLGTVGCINYAGYVNRGERMRQETTINGR